MFQSFIDTSTTAGNGIDMSWFYSYKHPRRNVNIWLLPWKQNGVFWHRVFACELYTYCAWVLVRVSASDDMLVVELSLKCCRNSHNNATNQKFTFCCVSLSLSVCLNRPLSPSFARFLCICVKYLVYAHIRCTEFLWTKTTNWRLCLAQWHIEKLVEWR